MNYPGEFDAKLHADDSGLHSKGYVHVETVHATHVPADAIVVPDAQLLFNGEFKRSGVDLILSRDDRELVFHDYFKGEKRAALSSPDGAHLTGDLVNALTGHVEYAQADGSASVSHVIGHVSKLTGTATAVRNGVSIILNNGDNVEKGDVVQSGSNSTLGITFIDGTVFGLSSNARMVLNEMVYDPNGSNNSSLLSLVAGTITFVAGETAKHGDMKIDTPVATMGIRGTAVLMAIHFKIPGGGLLQLNQDPPPADAVPEGEFQVLVEPDGTTGSYILFDKTTLTPLAVVDKAGQQINITNGILSQTTAPLSPEIQKLIDDVFSLKFTDNSNTKTTVVQNDSIVPVDGRLGFHLPDGTIPIFVTASNRSSSDNDPSSPPSFFFVQLLVTPDQTIARQGTPIHVTGGGVTSFAWQVSSDNGKDWTTVSTNTNYTPTEDDEGKLLQLIVNNGSGSQTFSFGAVQDTSDLVATLDSATAQEGAAIHITGVTDGGNAVSKGLSYAWQVFDGHTWNTVGTNATFTPTDTEEGKALRLVVTLNEVSGSESTTYSLGTVKPVAEAPTLTITSPTPSIAEETGTAALGISVAAHDSDDVLSIAISNVPTDATLTYVGADQLTHTLTPVGGVYTLTVAQLNGLTLHAGEQTGPVTLTVTATNTTTGETASVNDTISLTVNPIQENPIFSGSTATNANEEGGKVTLGATVATHDADDGAISVTITGLAHDLSTFNGGSYDSETGTWSGTAAEFNALSFKAGENSTQHLTITATTSGAEAGTTVESYTLTVNPIQENPTFGGSTATNANEEGGKVTLGASVAPHDGDDGAISVTITGLAGDLIGFNGGTYTSGTGTWTGTSAQFNALTFEAGENGTQNLTITASTGGPGAGSTVENYTLTVNPIQENPIFSGPTATNANEEGGKVTLGASVAPHDGDDGAISVTITGLAGDLIGFNGGTYTSGTGTWTGTSAQFNALTFEAGENGTQNLTITASTGGPGAGSRVENYTLTVNPIQENPIFSGSTATNANEEGGKVTLGASVAPHDGDDGAISVTITGLAGDLIGFNGGTYTSGTGTWTGTSAQFNALTFKAGENGTQNLTITATTSGAEAGSTVENYTLTVNPIQENPTFSGAVTTAASEQGGVVTLGATVAAHDADDGLVSVSINGLAHDLTNFSGGTYNAGAGTWSGTAAQFNALTFKAGEDGIQHLTITATTSGAEAGTTVESYTLTVNPIQENPTFSGAVTTAASEQGGVVTLGATVATHDADDGAISVTITGLAHDLSTFNGGSYTAATGTWSGTAAEFNALTFKAGEDGTQHLTITATTSGAEAGSTVENYTLTVNPVAEAASLAGTVTIVSGSSDSGIPLTIVATPFDSDDNLSIQITGVPNDATLTYVGADNNTHTLTPVGGVYTLTVAQLNDLKLNSDEDNSILHVVVTSSEGTSSTTSTVDIAVSVDSSFTIAAGDTFHLNGGTLTDHTITVDGTLIGFGTVTATNGLANIVDNGLIEASSSHSLDLNANITGKGTLELTNNTTMEIGGSVASSLKALFAVGGGSVGELILDDPKDFHAPISGFSGNDLIDLKHLAYSGSTSTVLDSTHTSATVGAETISLSMTSTQTVITVSESGTTAATITLQGNYTGHSFTFSGDGSGGTQFVDPLAIYSGATLEFQGASTDNVLFVNDASISGTLVLDDAAAFSGQISGFTGTSTVSDAIDLKGMAFDSATTWMYTANSAGTGGALTIHEGTTVVDTINFVGNYTTANFTVQSDGNGGTLITDPPADAGGQAVSGVVVQDPGPVVTPMVMHDPGPAATSTIVASAPNQTLSGLALSDTFVFNFAGVGHATVADFHPDFDALQFKSLIFANAQAALNATHDDGHGNAVVAIDAQDTITLGGVLKAQLHVSDFHIV